MDEMDASNGDFDPVSAINDIAKSELTDNVRRVLILLRAEVERMRCELSAAQSRIESLQILANQDPLLGIYNRRSFMRELERSIAVKNRYAVNTCLVFLDVDNLKTINDSRGHRAGDAALMHIASGLRYNARSTDVIGRLGGDEFGIILTHVTGPVAERKMRQLADFISRTPVNTAKGQFNVGISYGIVSIKKGMYADVLVELADQAMYEQKRSQYMHKNAG